MKTKHCTKCNEEKKLSEFHKDKNGKFNRRSDCKKCHNLSKTEKFKLHSVDILNRQNINRKLHPWGVILTGIKQRCENLNNSHYKYYGGRGIRNFLTVEDIKFLWDRDNAWELCQPSIHRKDNDKHYTISNCQFIELSENISERNTRVSSKPIFQYDLDGKFVREWNSIS